MTQTKESKETPEVEETDTSLLLDFSVPLKRAVGVAPNGETYEVRTVEEFGAEEEHVLKSERTRYGELESKSKLNKVERAEYSELLASLFDKVVVASEEAKASFVDKHRQKVLAFFTIGQLEEQAQLTTLANQAMRRGIPPTTES